MNQKKEPIVFSPDMDVILEDYIREGISSGDGDTVANRVEKALSWAGIKSQKGHSIGVLRRNYSRNERKDIPAGESAPESRLTAEYAGSEDMRSVREECIDAMRELLGDETPSKDYVKRLLDVPEICDRLIHHAQEHDMRVFREFLSESPYEFGRQQLDRTRNHARHHQPATLGSYIARTFGSDLPPIRTKQGEKGNRVMRDTLIQSLPIDPDRIAEETLIKLGLAPDDFMTYTLQARRRYTLAIRKRFLTLLAGAREVNRGDNEKTARILEVTREDDEKRLIIFRTVTEAKIEENGEKHRRYYEISATYCSVFENWEEAIRSQTHALEGLEQKISDYEKLLFGFKNYNQFHQSVQNALIGEAFVQCKKRRSFFDNKLVPLLSRFVEDENNLVLGHIIWTLSRGLENSRAKKAELERMRKLIEASQGN